MNEFELIDSSMNSELVASISKDIEGITESAITERREYQKEYRRVHRTELIAARKRYYKRNRDKQLAYQKAYRLKHKESIRKYQKAYRHRHREGIE